MRNRASRWSAKGHRDKGRWRKAPTSSCTSSVRLLIVSWLQAVAEQEPHDPGHLAVREAARVERQDQVRQTGGHPV